MSNLQAYDDWPTKQQAAQLLGVAEKTIDRLAMRGEIQKATRKRVGLSPVTVFHPADIARVKAEREHSPAPFVVPPTLDVQPVRDTSDMSETDTSRSLVRHDQDRLSDTIQLLASAIHPHFPLYLTIEQSVRYSGLSAGYLDRMVREGKLQRIEEGIRGYRYRRRDLDAL